MGGGGPSLAGAVVTIRTGVHEIDAPETVDALGGDRAVRELAQRRGEVEARVRAVGGWKYAFRSVADGDGSFSIEIPADLPAFEFRVEADFAAYLDPRRFLPGSPEIRRGVVLTLDPAGKIEGVLRGPRGEPVPGGVIGPGRRNGDWLLPLAFGDEAGRFSIGGLPPDEYGFPHVSGRGYAPVESKTIVVRPFEVSRVEFVLPVESWCSGRVVDVVGQPVAGARVIATPVEGRSPIASVSFSYDQATSDAIGAFRLCSLSAGEVRVDLEADGWVSPDPQTVHCRAGEGIEGIEFVPTHGARIRGKVLERDGRPVVHADVVARSAPRFSGAVAGRQGFSFREIWRRRETGEDGVFELRGLDPDLTYSVSVLRARPPDSAFVYPDASLPPSEPSGKERVLVLPKPASIRGVVREADTGKPVENLGVVLEWAAGGETPSLSEALACTSLDGSFEIGAIPPRTYRITFASRGFLPEVREEVGLKEGEVLGVGEVKLCRGGTLRGIVLDAKREKPVPGAFVDPVNPPWKRGKLWRLPWKQCRSDAAGAFELTGVDPRKVGLRVLHPDYVEETVGIEIGERGESGGVVVRLRPKEE